MRRLIRVLSPVLVCLFVFAAVNCSGPDNHATVTTGAFRTVPAPATASAIATIQPTSLALNPSPSASAPTQAAATATIPVTARATAAVAASATTSATFVPTATPTSAPTATSAPSTATSQPTATITPTSDFVTIQTAATTDKIVALTFDAGADRGFAEQILDTLKATGVVATFGMTGHWAQENPDLVQRMVDEGHMLMNHTMTHRSWTGFSTGAEPLSSAERASELKQTEDIVRGITGVKLQPYFRPPYGDYDDSVVTDLKADGYSVMVMWTVDSLGWAGRNVDQIVERVVNGAVPGAILLFHVGAASQDAAALPTIINALRAAGYQFVTIQHMVGR